MIEGRAGNITIRTPRPDEISSVIDVWHRSLDASLSFLQPEQRHSAAEERAFFREVVAVQCQLHVAEHGDTILGVLAMRGDEIDRLYVDPVAQRQGVGSVLLAHAKRLCPAGLRLVTLQRNEPACRFYEGHGFVAFARGQSPPPENEPDVWYRWDAARGATG